MSKKGKMGFVKEKKSFIRASGQRGVKVFLPV